MTWCSYDNGITGGVVAMPGFLKEFFPGDKLTKVLSLSSASSCQLPPSKVSLRGPLQMSLTLRTPF